MKKKKRTLDVVEIVRTCDVGPLAVPPSEGDDFRFRIEIVRSSQRRRRYAARVWRIEHYRVQPTFPQTAGRPGEEPCDEQLLVRDQRFAEGITGSTPAGVLREVLKRIEALLLPG